MSKKILVISSSPRRGGNSDTLCNEFLRGAIEAGHQGEKIFLKDCTINFCTGCGVCNTTHKCVQKDDMAKIIEKMVTADVIVLATPVYFYSMCGQLKTMIDRCVPRYTEMEGKEFYYIVTAADTSHKNMERVIEAIRGFSTECLPDTKECGVVYGTGAWEKGEIESTPAMKEAYEMGLKA